jgi:hypothetical protein
MLSGTIQMDTQNEKGSALIIAILILMVVTVIGIIASRTASIELRIATHDKVHKMTWFATDATVDELVPELMEQAIEMRLTGEDALEEVMQVDTTLLAAPTKAFYMNEDPGDCLDCVPSGDNYDIKLAAAAMGYSDVHVRVYGDTEFSPGNALQLPEGYHGRGKGLASGGAMIIYNIRGQGVAHTGTEARITNRWRHVIH